MQYTATWPTPETLTHLVAAAQSDATEAALNELLGVLRPALLAFFNRNHALDTAEDLTQSALVRIYNSLSTIDATRARPFIVTVACNLDRTACALRKRDVQRFAPGDSLHRAASPSAADRHAQYKELALAVHRVVASKMTPTQREVVLGLLRGDTPAEIGAKLGISPVTVRTRLMRARAMLHGELRAFLDEGPLDGNPQDRAG